MKRIVPLVPIVIVGLLIFASSAFLTVPPAFEAHSTLVWMDAVAHVMLYFFLGLVVTRYVAVGLGVNAVGAFVIATALCVTFGVLDEFHQMYVPNRGAEFRDVLWDLVGASAGGVSYVVAAGFGRWIKDFLSSAEIGPMRILSRAVVTVVFLVGIIVPSVLYAGKIAALAEAVVLAGASYTVGIIDFYSAKPQRAGDSAHLRSPNVSKAASLVSTVRDIAASRGGSASNPEPRAERAALRDGPQRNDNPKPEPSGNGRQTGRDEPGPESVGDPVDSSNVYVGADENPVDLSVAIATLKDYPGFAELVAAAAKDPVLRNNAVPTLASSPPQVRHAVHTWQERSHKGMSERLLGVGNGKPEPCDLVAVITQMSLPVGELTVDQVRKIFSGEFKNWTEVGGPDQPITVVTVRKQSGELEGYLMNRLKTGLSSDAVKLPFVSLMIPVVAETPGAVGFLPVRNTEQLDWVVGHEAFKRIGVKSDNLSPAVGPSRAAFNTGLYPFMKGAAPVQQIELTAHHYASANGDRKAR
ncbi:MAG: VanZ family protein [Desulfomonilaceae bacterium]|nr:VanZ family protein [Desulfomonilaceae bacterium]